MNWGSTFGSSKRSFIYPWRLHRLWRSQPFNQWVLWILSQWIKRLGPEADHSPPSSAGRKWLEQYFLQPFSLRGKYHVAHSKHYLEIQGDSFQYAHRHACHWTWLYNSPDMNPCYILVGVHEGKNVSKTNWHRGVQPGRVEQRGHLLLRSNEFTHSYFRSCMIDL
jgi:hypothetical protein